MSNDSVDPRSFSIITSPIPLLALYGGIIELIVAALVFKIEPQYQIYLVVGAIALPFAWLIVIYRLIANYHQNLYAPKDFLAPEHFLATLPAEVANSVSKGTLGSPTIYAPFKLSENTSQSSFDSLQNDLARSSVNQFLINVRVTDLLTMHAWYNENNSHLLAFQALSLAIAKEMKTDEAASKNYSFASASLRKLNRLDEAQAFASLALQFNPNNLDAKYNLALIHKRNDRETALQFAREVNRIGEQYYKQRLREEFSELRNEDYSPQA